MFLIVCLSYVLHIHSMAIDMHVATMQNSPPLAASPKLLDLVFFDGGNGWSAYHGGMLHIVPLTISDVYIYIYMPLLNAPSSASFGIIEYWDHDTPNAPLRCVAQ